MTAKSLRALVNEARDAESMDDIKLIVELIIEHLYYRQCEKERNEK